MSADPVDLEAYAEVMANALHLPPDAGDRAAILANLGIAFRFAERFLAFDLPEDAEPLPVFAPLPLPSEQVP